MPYIEEIDDDDIDNKHFSIDDFDSHNPFSRDMPVEEGAPIQLIPTRPSQPSSAAPPTPDFSRDFPSSSGGNTSNIAPSQALPNHGPELPEHMKSWKVLYPIYFDKNKSVKQGRRVPEVFAVANPLAVTIADACRSLGFEPALELTKRHPKDWANPGRVRIKMPAGRSKREVYTQISKFLKSYPVNSQTAREMMYRQIAQFDSLSPLAVPRNTSLPKILPGVSPALSSRKIIQESMKMDGSEMAKMMGM